MAVIFTRGFDRAKPAQPPEWTRTRIGQTAPRFRVTTTDGRVFDSAALRRKPLLLTFFATYCGPCGHELTRLEPEVWRGGKGRGLTVLAISIDDDNVALRRFWAQKGFTFPVASDKAGKVFPKFAVGAIPRTYLIDTQGRIVYQSLGYSAEEFPRLAAAVDRELLRVP